MTRTYRGHQGFCLPTGTALRASWSEHAGLKLFDPERTVDGIDGMSPASLGSVPSRRVFSAQNLMKACETCHIPMQPTLRRGGLYRPSLCDSQASK